MKENIEDIKQNIDLSVRRRRYYGEEYNLTNCPECNSSLTEEGEFMTSLSGSHFCNNCPVVVFDTEKIEQAAKIGIKSDENLK
jgi:hypothetical protein